MVCCREEYKSNIDTLVTWLWALPVGCFSFAFLLALLYVLPGLLHSLHKKLPGPAETAAAGAEELGGEPQAKGGTAGSVPAPLETGRKRVAFTEVVVWSGVAALLFVAGAILLIMGAAHLYTVAGWFGPSLSGVSPKFGRRAGVQLQRGTGASVSSSEILALYHLCRGCIVFSRSSISASLWVLA